MTRIYNLKQTTEVRFYKKVGISSSDECWEWLGGKTKKGYGCFSVRVGVGLRKHMLAHRYSYFLSHGTIDDNLEVCHTCDNPSCVNPNHLFLGTHQDNEIDKVSKGRQAQGIRNGQSGRKGWSNVLSEVEVLEIRESKDSGSSLSRLYGVSQQTICDIRKRRSWSWL